MATKITLKNALVYKFLKDHYDADQMAGNVKAIYHANKAEIDRRFKISTYASFNFHIRRAMNFEAQGNTIESVLNNKELNK